MHHVYYILGVLSLGAAVALVVSTPAWALLVVALMLFVAGMVSVGVRDMERT